MSFDWGIDWGPPDRWLIVKTDGNAVVCVHDSNPLMVDHSNKNILGRCRSKMSDWEFVAVTKEEFETLGVICDLPMIDITEFIEWENDYVKRNRHGYPANSDDTRGASRNGISNLYQRWRMFWVSI